MYHSVEKNISAEPGAGLYCISLDQFKEQMQFVIKSEQPVLITFDDGDITNYSYAFVILKELRLQAYFFVLGSKIGRTGYMDWPQIRELRKAGMIIGSHGMTHRILTGLNDQDLDYELRESKRMLEIELGDPVVYFSVPRGFYDQRVIDFAKRAGYTTVFTSDPRDRDGFKVGRLPVKAQWSLSDFQCAIATGFEKKGKAAQLFKDTLKRILGAKNYDALRSKVLR
jgi:peptidoglycan/xylan/chitin deacetylase (PgdA/CDA1 family)